MDNDDAIDGPGNNSYLWWDETASRMTVVAWDTTSPSASATGPAARVRAGRSGSRWLRPVPSPRRPAPTACAAPRAWRARTRWTRGEPVRHPVRGGPAFSTLVSEASARLRADLFAGGVATTSLRTWSTLLAEEADWLVDAGTLEEERAAIAAYFD